VILKPINLAGEGKHHDSISHKVCLGGAYATGVPDFRGGKTISRRFIPSAYKKSPAGDNARGALKNQLRIPNKAHRAAVGKPTAAPWAFHHRPIINGRIR
jgi:hypothetical protein